MTDHVWSTYQRTDDKQHDECRYCDALRWKGDNTNWSWQYNHGGQTCAGADDPSPQERRVIAEGRDG